MPRALGWFHIAAPRSTQGQTSCFWAQTRIWRLDAPKIHWGSTSRVRSLLNVALLERARAQAARLDKRFDAGGEGGWGVRSPLERALFHFTGVPREFPEALGYRCERL